MSFALILAAALAATPAAAQDDPRQTPENAKRFIEQTLPGSVGLSNFASGPVQVRIVSAVPNDTSECDLTTPLVGVIDGRAFSEGTWNFRRVRGIAQSGTSVIVSYSTGTFTVSAGSEAMAARMAYAMEFLRQHCDPAADTGF